MEFDLAVTLRNKGKREKMLIKELLQRQSQNDRAGIKFGEEYESYKSLNNKVNKIKEKLICLEWELSQCIIIMLPNSINYAVAYFVVSFMDKVIVPIDPKASVAELSALLDYCNANVIITDSTLYDELIKEQNILLQSVCIINIENCCNEIYKTVRVETGIYDKELIDVAILLHTSGTTSNPKRVMLTHENLVANIESNVAALGLSGSDKVLIALPMYFGYCNTAQFLTHVYLGANIVIFKQIFTAKKFHQLVQEEGITNFTAVPTMLMILNEYRYALNYNVCSLRFICFGGSGIEINVLRKIIEKYNTVDFIHTYGQTECSPRVTMLPAQNAINKLGSVGKAIPNVALRLVDDNGKECMANEIGEIEVKGKNVMKGYYKNLVETEKVMDGGWLRTGDLGFLDADGFLYITGRRKNIIITGGINIYPEEIEQVLLQFEGIKEAYVFAEKDKWLGEVPFAKIVVEEKGIEEDELICFCKKKMAEYKVPRKFITVEKIDKTYNGKVKRQAH